MWVGLAARDKEIRMDHHIVKLANYGYSRYSMISPVRVKTRVLSYHKNGINIWSSPQPYPILLHGQQVTPAVWASINWAIYFWGKAVPCWSMLILRQGWGNGFNTWIYRNICITQIYIYTNEMHVGRYLKRVIYKNHDLLGCENQLIVTYQVLYIYIYYTTHQTPIYRQLDTSRIYCG